MLLDAAKYLGGGSVGDARDPGLGLQMTTALIDAYVGDFLVTVQRLGLLLHAAQLFAQTKGS